MDLSLISTTLWEYRFVGGGLCASVVAHGLLEFDPKLKILAVEAGPNANDRPDIAWPNSTNVIGGDFDFRGINEPGVPLRDRVLRAWAELDVEAFPGLDGDAGNPLGVGDL
ncbi:hypothetical protein DL769_005522 [Monosporascus sp. CRB-8-3]|nr:hypothetical protein DL769_005522 [Monosporascus sp. CRB-8-3]